MNNLYITLTLILYSISTTAQMDYRSYENLRSDEQALSVDNPIISYTADVLSEENFKYRSFLRSAKESKDTYLIGEENFSKADLTKLLRRTAKRSANSSEFNLNLTNRNAGLTAYFSQSQTDSLYRKFKKATVNMYMVNLANNWDY